MARTVDIIDRLLRATKEHRVALGRFPLAREQRTAINASLRTLQRAARAAASRLDRMRRKGGTSAQRKLKVENVLLRRMLKMRSLEGPAFRRRLAEVEAVRRVVVRNVTKEAKDARIASALAAVRAGAALPSTEDRPPSRVAAPVGPGPDQPSPDAAPPD